MVCVCVFKAAEWVSRLQVPITRLWLVRTWRWCQRGLFLLPVSCCCATKNEFNSICWFWLPSGSGHLLEVWTERSDKTRSRRRRRRRAPLRIALKWHSLTMPRYFTYYSGKEMLPLQSVDFSYLVSVSSGCQTHVAPPASLTPLLVLLLHGR